MEHHVGRLGEIRITGSLTLAEMSTYRSRFATLLQTLPGKLVFCNDLRAAHAITPEVEQQGIALMRAATPRIERAAMLVSRKGVFGVQMLRATLSTDSRVRRVFHDPHEVEQWLGEVLDAAERERLRAFLTHHD
jgi:hypothetical protein